MGINSDFKRKVLRPYNRRKKILDLKALERFKIRRKHLLYALGLLIFFMLNRRYFMFLAMSVFSFVFSFYHSKYNRTPLDFKLALFFGVFVTRYYGIAMTLLFFIATDIIPALMAGESVQGSDLFFFAWYFIVNSAVLLFPELPLVLLGPFVVILHDIGAIFINSFFGIPGMLSFFLSVLTSLVRIIYFMIFGRLLEALLMSI